MWKKILYTMVLCTIAMQPTRAQYAYGDHWYHNPLGFQPLNLHTSMGFLLPAVAAGACLLLTGKDSTLGRKLSVFEEVGVSWGYKYPFTLLAHNNAGIDYQVRRFLSVGVAGSFLVARDAFNRTTGFAIRPFARFYPVNRQKWQLYFESGGGLVYTLDEFPMPTDRDERVGLLLNGITQYGLGASMALSEATSVQVGVRHVHISNGNTRGVSRNPSHDSNGIFVGVAHRWR